MPFIEQSGLPVHAGRTRVRLECDLSGTRVGLELDYSGTRVEQGYFLRAFLFFLSLSLEPSSVLFKYGSMLAGTVCAANTQKMSKKLTNTS